MSISSALSNALSGLTASSRGTQIVSSNIANATTPGFAKRSLELTTLGHGHSGGVTIVGVSRTVDQNLLNERRIADSEVSYASTKSDFFTNLERVIGTPDEPLSLTGRISAFEADLITASSKPEEETRLHAAVNSAISVAAALNDVSASIQAMRNEAEDQIEKDVQDVNKYLSQIEQLNARILDAKISGLSEAAFLDQRSVVLDQLSEIVPLRVLQRDNGAIALYTPAGASLLDGSPSVLSYSATNLVTADMTLQNGLLSGLEINGIPVSTTGDGSAIDGGRLSANFELRDEIGVEAQSQLDAVTRDLILRFQDAGLDATRNVGDAGLFTDRGGAFDTLDEVGISGRIEVNEAVNPDAGGAHWRLRDGLGATVPGPAGDAALLNDLHQALAQNSTLNSGSLGASSRDLVDHISALVSSFGQERLALEQSLSFATAQQFGLRENELAQGVDTDAELQQLLLLEQSYNANARIIQVADEMIDALLRI